VSDIIEAFDLSAPKYDVWYETPKGRQVLKTELKALDGLIPGTGVGVEIGAGTGIFAESLTSNARTIVCIDPSIGMLRRASEKGLYAILAPGERPPLRNRCLGFAYLVTVLEFVEEPSAVLEGTKGALRDGSPVIVLTINRESPWGALYERLRDEGNPIFSVARLYGFEEARAFIEAAGLAVDEAFGTLISGPDEPDAGDGRVPPGSPAGVFLFRAIKEG
jgi:SAM-dependent methyltransferase